MGSSRKEKPMLSVPFYHETWLPSVLPLRGRTPTEATRVNGVHDSEVRSADGSLWWCWNFSIRLESCRHVCRLAARFRDGVVDRLLLKSGTLQFRIAGEPGHRYLTLQEFRATN